MTVEEHVKRLRQGAGVWNAWRQEHPGETIDLIGVHLNGADLSGVDLGYADLNGADLSGAHLSGANLNDANLNDADLIGTHLSDADLIGIHLRYADLSGADLSGARLSGANLNDAHLSFADLSRAHLSFAHLSRADLSGAHLRYADLSRADLSRAHLRYADLSRAHLSRADLSNAIVGWTVFGDVDLRTVKNLETIRHRGPSYISTSTLSRSQGDIPDIFLRGAGLDDTFIDYVRSLTTRPIEYSTCLISYSSKDELFARQLHNDLQQEGIRCWFAPEDMNIGDTIRHRIDESIRLYDKLLLILSAPALASTWIAYEVEQALNKEPQGTHHVLYPIRIDQGILTCTEPWALDIKSTRYIGNFEHWTDPQQYEKSFKRLLHALNTKKEQQKN